MKKYNLLIYIVIVLFIVLGIIYAEINVMLSMLFLAIAYGIGYYFRKIL